MTRTIVPSTISRRLARLVLAVAIVSASLVGLTMPLHPSASAQVGVVGSADFRNAPQLAPGQYSDRIVTGDTAWYSLVYSNDTPYTFEVSFRGSAPSDAELTASFVAPTLTTVDGPAASVSGNGVAYPAGHTNVWFLKVTLSTTGQAGVDYPIVITVDGVQSVGVASCDETAGCTLDDEYATVASDLSQAQVELDALREQETLSAVESEIQNLKGFIQTTETVRPGIQSRLANAQSAIATLCAPEPDCAEFPDPGTRTPPIGLIVGALALIGGAYAAFKKLTSPEETDDDAGQARAVSSAAHT